MPDADVADARDGVVRALARMELGERNALDGMRAALCAMVSALKAAGATREQTMDEVRRIIAEPVTPDGELSLLAPAREALVELSVYWCLGEFGSD